MNMECVQDELTTLHQKVTFTYATGMRCPGGAIS